MLNYLTILLLGSIFILLWVPSSSFQSTISPTNKKFRSNFYTAVRLLTPSILKSGTNENMHGASKKRSPLLGTYNYIYRDLFRVNSGEKVILRDFSSQKRLDRSSYDLVLKEDGLVHPAENTGNFEGPNGASVRPNSPFMQEIIRGYKGKGVTVYLLKEGTKLPPELTLLHEHTDHHSIQCTKPMKLKDLNALLTDFCKTKGVRMTKQEFVEKYPFESCDAF